ncbi:hypothetical protein ACROYT_G010072 [Oculina patagonica]
MKLKRIFSFLVAISSISIVVIIVYMEGTVQGLIKRFSPVGMDDHSSAHSSTELTAQRRTKLPTRKPFIYLTQTEQCLPPNLATSSQIGDPETCNCDVIVLSYRAKCQENNRSHISYLFDPNTLFASGRNVLFSAATNRRPGYHYYIFLDNDTVLEYNIFTPANMTRLSPFRVMEKWLLDYEPAVGVLDFKHHGASVMLENRRYFCGINETSLVLPTVFFDAIFNAFHHQAVEHVLPYPTQFERECVFVSNRNTMIAVEVKFGGQALLFAPVTANNVRHRHKYKYCKTYRERAILRKLIQRIKQEAPPKLRNHAIFTMLHENPDLYLVRRGPTQLSKNRSQSLCVNVTRHQPIIPYRHLLNKVQI